MKPTVGRIVHYVSYGTPAGEFTPQCRAAVVTAISQDVPFEGERWFADLCVLNPTGMYFNLGCPQNESDHVGGSWHWPEREDSEKGGK